MTDLQVHEKLKDMVPVSTTVTPGPGKMSIGQWGYGLLYTIISAIFPIIIQTFVNKSFTIDWKTIGTTCAAVAGTYILANLPKPTQQITTFKKQ